MTQELPFIHLRVHTAYSLAEGAIKTGQLLELVEKKGMPAVAITDTNNMFGAMDLSLSAVKKGMQPIIGCQLDILVNDEEQKKNRNGTKAGLIAPIVLLAQNEAGYKNLCRLVSRAYLEKDRLDETHVTMETLQSLNDGLICLTGGPVGPLGKILATGNQQKALAHLKDLQACFGDRLYMELMRHDEWDQALDQTMIEIAHAENLPLVATNNCFFPTEEFYGAHDALLCIADGRYVSEDDRRKETPDHYFKSQEEMKALFADVPEAITNTAYIAQRCHFWLKPIDPELPSCETSEGRTEAEELRYQSEQGLEWRLQTYIYKPSMPDAEKKALRQEYFDRLDEEMAIISQMGYDGYFLIVADFIQWAKDHNIPVGPGRGSGGGSVVAWAMKIIDINPLEYGLLFERFLNPERVSMPDFDIDFCQARREEVIKYVQEKYGRDRVAQIITFGKLQARAVVRDVGRVLQMPYGQVDRISKMIPNNPAKPTTLQEALDGDPELQRMRRDDETTGHLIDTALQLEGLYRHASTHAAGIVIGNKPLEEIMPLYKDSKSDMPATQFNLKYVELASLVKFDFLGLKTLTVLQKALDNIDRTEQEQIDILALDMQDKLTLDKMGEGGAVGIFQFEAQFIQDVLKKFKPEKFEDLIALTSLNRPGPMDNIPDYIEIKHGRKELEYPHGKLEGLLKETYGIMVYQEQVMESAKILAGYTLGGADLLRRAMGKKIKEAMDIERDKFVKGCGEISDIDADRANEIFDLIAKFAGYGFNKSHAAAYSLISYQSAYLKAHYPVEFMAAIMTLDMGNTDKINFFRQDLRRMKIALLPPDINHSVVDFNVEINVDNQKNIRYALGAIKGAGEAAMAELVTERSRNGPYKNMEDFARRLNPKTLNRRQLEVLASAGAFDCFGLPRAQVAQGADHMMRQAHKWRDEQESGQESLFGSGGATTTQLAENFALPDAEEWDDLDALQHEFSAIGFYLSAHPLDAQQEVLKKNGYLTVEGIKEKLSRSATGTMRAKIAGVVIKRQEKNSERGRWAFVTLSGQTGLYDAAIYTDALMAYRDILESGTMVSLEADATLRDDDVRLVIRIVNLLDDDVARRLRKVEIECQSITQLHDLQAVLANENDGNGTPVQVDILFPVQDVANTVRLRFKNRIPLSTKDHETLKRLKNITVKAI